MWFRSINALTALAAWALLLWLAQHESGEAVYLGRYSGAYLALLIAFAALAALCTACCFGDRHRWLRQHIRLPALVLVSSLASLAGAEAIVRATDLLGISYYEESRRYMLDKIADDQMHNRHPSEWRAIYQGIEVETNELGLRDGPVQRKAADEFRILFLGDSVTFGWGVSQSDTFVRRIEASLQRQTATTVRAINSGVGGYNTEMESEFLKRHGTELAPDLVVLLYVANDANLTPTSPYDPRARTALDLRSPATTLRILLWKSWLYRLSRHTWDARSGWGKGGATPQTIVSQPTGHRFPTPGWRTSMRALGEIARFCEDRKLPFVAFIYRFDDNMWLANTTVEIRERARDQGFYAADLRLSEKDPSFRELRNSAVDSHPNSSGHELLAEAMVDFLVAAELVPGS